MTNNDRSLLYLANMGIWLILFNQAMLTASYFVRGFSFGVAGVMLIAAVVAFFDKSPVGP